VGTNVPQKKKGKKKHKAVVGAGEYIEVLLRVKCFEAVHWRRGGRDKLKRRRRRDKKFRGGGNAKNRIPLLVERW